MVQKLELELRSLVTFGYITNQWRSQEVGGGMKTKILMLCRNMLLTPY